MDHAPHAEIRRIGHWTHAVRIMDGLTQYGPYAGGSWHVLGGRRARRFAVRQLRQHPTDATRGARVQIVYLEDA